MLSLAWRRVRWPLQRPLVVGGQAMSSRVVLELRLRDDRGRGGCGEAAPLPGLHTEGVDELPALLPRALAELNATTAGSYRARLAVLAARGGWTVLPPSLRCGLEGALLELMAEGRDAASLLDLPVGEAPPASALIAGDLDDLPAGCRCVKVKVGRREIEREVAVVRQLRQEGGEGLEIRLDANCAFDLQQAVTFAAALRPYRPVWIEEPVFHPAELTEFMARGGLPVALDETLQEPASAALDHAPGVAAWVLKPARLGVLGTLRAFERARGVSCVVGSSFESPRGLALLATLARCAPGLPAPGLGTDRWFTGEEEPLEGWTDVPR